MPSLRSINAEAGTHFTRWKELTEAVTIEEAKPTPIPEVDETIQSVNCAKCGGTLHAWSNYPNLFKCGTCGTVQKLEPTPEVEEPEPEPEPTETEVREAEHVRQPSPDFPRKLSDR